MIISYMSNIHKNTHPHFLTLQFTPMSSFGFTEKGSGKASHQAIGVYGNGFKSGSMRLGRDALIFTKNGGCQTVGMLSQTYLENIKAQAVIVPIVPFNQQTNILHEQEGRGWKKSEDVCVCGVCSLFSIGVSDHRMFMIDLNANTLS